MKSIVQRVAQKYANTDVKWDITINWLKRRGNTYSWEGEFSTNSTVFFGSGTSDLDGNIVGDPDFDLEYGVYILPPVINKTISNLFKDEIHKEVAWRYPAKVDNTRVFYIPGGARSLTSSDMRKYDIHGVGDVRVRKGEKTIEQALAAFKAYNTKIKAEDFGNYTTLLGVIHWFDVDQWSAVYTQYFSRS